MSYWDIESFLAEEQPTQFKFTEDMEGMAFLDASKGITGIVLADSPLHTPIWVIPTLVNYMYKSKHFITQVMMAI